MQRLQNNFSKGNHNLLPSTYSFCLQFDDLHFNLASYSAVIHEARLETQLQR